MNAKKMGYKQDETAVGRQDINKRIHYLVEERKFRKDIFGWMPLSIFDQRFNGWLFVLV